jgi:hypothetical protein
MCGTRFETNSTVSGRFCSRSCGVKYSNSVRPRKPDAEKEKISQGLKKYFALHPRPVTVRSSANNTRMKVERDSEIEIHCRECGVGFSASWKSVAKYCSVCRLQRHSESRAAYLSEHGTTNFAIRVPGFQYKHVTIDCDSRLETAAVEYLVEYLGADSIERIKSILTYKDDDGVTRRYNPDFYVRIGDRRLIVEVKQTPAKSSRHNSYNRFFPQKKQALDDFARSRGFESMWLDFEFDQRFRKIYYRIIKRPLTS